ncbi:LPS assembly protein LptD [Vibrio sp. 10N.286.49.B3]|uniref:LPS assembly protein LptD n=1 Tax=Vibrio sp. 10N.286.49.B3 TaxID=1880855 RepID=UPI000C82E3D0|nr:LPS assembly protein LptD [Vibrio sp. 10N.286.49.B3]PMH39855.1 LPS assembly protein LptD [Vibrio sp. 10N.286.49.B3]
MQCFSRTFLAASISAAIFVPTTQANTTFDDKQKMPIIDQCLVDTSTSTDEPIDETQLPVTVEADGLEAINGEKLIYSGNVNVTQGSKKVTADSVTYHQVDNIAVAEGNVTFNDGQIATKSDKVTNNLAADEFSLENTEYKFLCEQGRGNAAYIAKTGKAIYELEDGSLTSCPEGDRSWRMIAGHIEVDQDEEVATFHHAKLEVMDVPVFYTPYLTLPIGDSRKTGLLFPSISYGSSDGVEFEIPIYWNIAPNYDAEFNVHYMQQRGVKFDGDFRYLTDGYGKGEVKTEFLVDDQKYTDQASRWGFQYEHSGIINQHWKVSTDFSRVSDVDYFRDLDSNIGNREDGQLIQEGSIAYRTNNWDMSLLVRDFQVLLEDDALPYRIMPQIAFNYYTPVWNNKITFDVKSQLSQFETDDETQPSALRVHVEPGITIPISSTWATWTTEARLLATHYQQDFDGIIENSDGSERKLDETVTRVLPEIRTYAGVYLERDTTIWGGYTQTLEPKIQYLYVPETDQSNIYEYDTTLLQTDYYGLFRSRKYSSIDKVAAANQVTYGATTRFFDEDNKERLNISFGQIYYIDKTTKLTGSDQSEQSNYSSWAVEADFNFNDYLFYHGGIQYDVDLSSMQLANSTLEYQFKKGFVQANYRYVTKEYIEDTINFDLDNVTNDGISQAGIVAAYQINNNWSASGQYYYDMTEQTELEWLANLRYQSDCWYIGFTYSNQIRGWNGNLGASGSQPDYESNLSVNFGIQGFSTNTAANSAVRDFDSSDNAIEYGRPFYLND